jgi:hypothetical protein
MHLLILLLDFLEFIQHNTKCPPGQYSEFVLFPEYFHVNALSVNHDRQCAQAAEACEQALLAQYIDK